MHQHLAQQSAAQMPPVALPDPLDVAAVHELAEDGVKAVAHAAERGAKARVGKRPALRYQTKPGAQHQFDSGEFIDEEAGTTRKDFGFPAILSSSRIRFACYTKHADAHPLTHGGV